MAPNNHAMRAKTPNPLVLVMKELSLMELQRNLNPNKIFTDAVK